MSQPSQAPAARSRALGLLRLEFGGDQISRGYEGALRPVGAPRARFRLMAVGPWEPPGGGWIKAFCSRCGSQLFSQDPEDSDTVSIRMGSFDEDPGLRPSAHQFTAYAPAWAPVPEDGLSRYPERMPGE